MDQNTNEKRLARCLQASKQGQPGRRGRWAPQSRQTWGPTGFQAGLADPRTSRGFSEAADPGASQEDEGSRFQTGPR